VLYDAGLTPDDIKELKELADKTSLAKILKTLKLFSQAEISTDSHSALSIELAIIDSTQKEEPEPAAPAHQPEHVPPRRVEVASSTPAVKTVKPPERPATRRSAYTPSHAV
jgi:hypothetical protein